MSTRPHPAPDVRPEETAMTPGTHLAALTSSIAALAEERDVVSTLVETVAACAEALGADVGVVVTEDPTAPPAGRLDLLAASSHAEASLELYQPQVDSGPCLDALTGDEDLSVVGAGAMRDRWPRLASALARSGYHAAHAFVLRWRGTPFGVLNLYLPRAHPLTADERRSARGFADIAAIAIVHAGDRPDLAAIAAAVRATAEHRAPLEQAKGALRYLLGADEGEAFRVLTEQARATRVPITEVARATVDAVSAGRRPDWLPGR